MSCGDVEHTGLVGRGRSRTAARAGAVAFWLLVAAIVTARSLMFQPDPFASIQHVEAPQGVRR